MWIAGRSLQLRDVEILKAVAELRVLTTDQLSRLFFPSASSTSTNCRTRLRFLETAGFLKREYQLQAPTDGRKPHVFRITPAGIHMLIEEIGLDEDEFRWHRRARRLSSLFLAHQLELNEVYVRFIVAFIVEAPSVRWQVREWYDDFDLKESHTATFSIRDDRGAEASVGVVPDGFMAIAPVPQWPLLHFFIELDRGTMPVRARKRLGHGFQRKILAYNAFFRSPEIMTLYGTRRFRVLSVTTSFERLQNLKAATEGADGRSRYWFTTLQNLTTRNPFTDPIWYRASETEPRPLCQDPTES